MTMPQTQSESFMAAWECCRCGHLWPKRAEIERPVKCAQCTVPNRVGLVDKEEHDAKTKGD